MLCQVRVFLKTTTSTKTSGTAKARQGPCLGPFLQPGRLWTRLLQATWDSGLSCGSDLRAGLFGGCMWVRGCVCACACECVCVCGVGVGGAGVKGLGSLSGSGQGQCPAWAPPSEPWGLRPRIDGGGGERGARHSSGWGERGLCCLKWSPPPPASSHAGGLCQRW